MHVSIKRNHLFLYNTLNGKVLEYQDKPILANLVKQLQAKENLLVIALDNDDINHNREISGFIKDVRACFMGHLLDAPAGPGLKKPVQLMPYLNIEKDIHRLGKKPNPNTGKEILNHLKEITFFLNDGCAQNCTLCAGAYKQLPCCHKNTNKKSELKPTHIKKVIDSIMDGRVHTINILGGNILEYSSFDALDSLLKKIQIPIYYYIHYLNLKNQKERMAQLCEEGSVLRIPVSFPVEEKEFENLVTLITGINMSPDFIFIIETEENTAQAQALISRFDIENYSFSPYFNGKNLRFFEKYVFITRANILESKPSITEILSRGAVNLSHYGKVTILSNGDIYSHLNLAKMGNITGESLHKIFYRQLKAGKSSSLYNAWWRTREQVVPCKHCHYNRLCPSMSNYESIIGRNNLCHIWAKS